MIVALKEKQWRSWIWSEYTSTYGEINNIIKSKLQLSEQGTTSHGGENYDEGTFVMSDRFTEGDNY